jgi:hypothetical protein
LTSFWKKLEVLKNKRNLACSKVIVDEDSSIEVRKTMEDSVPYLKDAKKWSHKAFLRKDVLLLNGRKHDLSYLREKSNLKPRSGSWTTLWKPRI